MVSNNHALDRSGEEKMVGGVILAPFITGLCENTRENRCAAQTIPKTMIESLSYLPEGSFLSSSTAVGLSLGSQWILGVPNHRRWVKQCIQRKTY